MVKFFKKIFSPRNGPHTVVVIDDDGSKPSTSHRINPINLWLIFFGIVGGGTCLFIVLMMFTPLGGFIYNNQNVRESVIEIQQKVAALQDTLEARNMQLQQIQSVMASGEDTVFTSGVTVSNPEQNSNNTAEFQEEPDSMSLDAARIGIPADALYIANLMQRSPEFPAPYPVDGSPTRIFNSSIGHYGLDIAAKEGAQFRAIADGVIINQEWTLNYGYVIVVQHSNGLVSIYKHASGVDKKIGESVLKGDILGTIGDIGILSSGPHLHIEIWERGVPQNPQNYLINT